MRARRECPSHGSLLHRWTSYRCWAGRAVNRLAVLWPLRMFENGKLKAAFHHVAAQLDGGTCGVSPKQQSYRKPNRRHGIEKEGGCSLLPAGHSFCPTGSHFAAVLLRRAVWLTGTGTSSSQTRLWMFGECSRPSVQKKRGSHRRRDRRPQKTSRCYGAALEAEEENHNHNAAITAVSKSPGWSAMCFSSVSAALAASHTTSSLGRHSLPDLGWRNYCNNNRTCSLRAIHPVSYSQPRSGLCIIFFKSMKRSHLCSDFEPRLFLSGVLREAY